jgi:hypothetical protein
MGLTVSNQAAYIYNLYALQSSDTYKNNTVDESEVSSETYGISNLANAIDAMEEAYSVDLNSIGNVDSYVNTLYQTSQIDIYSELSEASENALLDLLTDDDSLSDIYTLIAPDAEANAAFLESIVDAASSDVISSYDAYMDDTQSSSLLDVSV